MKRMILFISLLFFAQIAFAQVSTIWEKSKAKNTFPSGFMGTAHTERGFATGKVTLNPFEKLMERSEIAKNYPSYLGTANTDRGFAYGVSNNVEKLYIVGRKLANNIFIVNPATGDSLSKLDVTGISGGAIALNDVEVSADGYVYACNVTTNASTSAFKVYKWDSDASAPKVAISYTGTALRYGDKFTVTGSTADNSITVWAASAASNKVVKFTSTDKGETFASSEITLTGANNGSSPAVYPSNDGSKLYLNSNGTLVKEYSATGTFLGEIPGSIIGTGSNSLRYFEVDGKKFLAVYAYGIGNENIRVVEITDGLSSAKLVGATTSMYFRANANGTGEIAIKNNGNKTYTLFVLGTNNGIASYKVIPTNYGSFQRMYLVSRLNTTKIIVMDAANGDSLKILNLAGIAGGTFTLNDVEVAVSGEIFACNLTTNASTSPFKIYKWKDEAAAPIPIINYNGLAIRFGDKFTVTGSSADNTLTIWAVGASSNKIVKFTTSDNGTSFNATEINLTGVNVLSSPVVYPNNDGTKLYVNSNGTEVKEYNSDGTFIEALPTTLISTGANALRYMEIEGRKYLAVFAYGTGNENLRMVDISKGMMSASLIATTPSLGTIANPNGAGDVSFTNHNDGTATLYVLGTNNGAGSYLFNPPKDVSTPSFNPGPGNYFESITVNITVSTSDAKIYYTTDNSDPDTSSTLYNKPIKINKSTIFKAIAFADGMNPSKIGSATYIIPTSKRLYSIWGKTQADKNFPRYFSTQNYERGMDVGIFNGKPRVVVVGRWLGPKVIMFDPIFGDSLSTILPDATIAGGTFPINFPGLSADGILFVGNMTIDVASSPFKVYRYDNETDPAKTVINYTDPALVGGRVGDMISVFGKASDNTLTIFAGVAQQNKIVKFSTSDKGLTFTPTTITLQNANIGTVPNITFATATTFYIKSYGKPVYYYDINGTLLDSIPTTVISSDVTNIKLIERSGKKYLLCYHPNDGGLLTDERMTVVEVTNPGITSWVYYTDSMGEIPNLNATGAVGYYKVNDDEIFYMLGTNNGLAAYSVKPVLVSVEDNIESIPQEFMLEQNYPNPFNPSTIIKFTLKTDASVKLTIYNLLGEEVSSLLNSELRAGIHSVSFKPISLAGGVYFYRLEVLGVDGSKFMSVKKLIYLK